MLQPNPGLSDAEHREQLEHFLAALRDALAPPYPTTDDTSRAYLELVRDRAVIARAALTHVLSLGNIRQATDMVDVGVAGQATTEVCG